MWVTFAAARGTDMGMRHLVNLSMRRSLKNKAWERARLSRAPRPRYASLGEADDLAAVLRRRFIGEDFVVAQLIAGHAVVIPLERIVDLQISRITQVAEQRDDRDIDHVVTEAASVRPSAGHEEFARSQSEELARQTERMSGGFALQNVSAEDAQAGEAHVVRVVRRPRPIAGQPNRVGSEIDLN